MYPSDVNEKADSDRVWLLREAFLGVCILEML